MTPLCAFIDDCTTNNSLSVGTIIGIVVAILAVFAALITGIVFLRVLCKRKSRPPVVWVVQHQPYSQAYGFNSPPPPYQGESTSIVSS